MSMSTDQGRYRIVCFDGGGIRGLVSLVLLQRLEQAVPGLVAKADLLAGTSIGGITALALAMGILPAELRAIYEKRAEFIFARRRWRSLARLGRAFGAKYDAGGVCAEMKRIFGGLKLKDIEKRVLIPAFDLDGEKSHDRCWAPKFFHNFPGADSDGDCPLWKAALYTSAAPTYFPSVDGYIDGGVAANNPSMAALALTQDHRLFGEHPPPFSRIVMLSLGAGKSLMRIEKKHLDWGYVQWAKPILSIIFDGVMGVADYQCRQILGGKYFRLSPVFPKPGFADFDAVKHVPRLVEFAESVDLKPASAWLNAVWI